MADPKRFASSVARARPGPTVPVPLETRARLLAEMRGEPEVADEDMEIEVHGDVQPRSAPAPRPASVPGDFEEISFDDL